MIYVLSHTPKANDWIAQHPRLYAYPKLPDTSGSELVILDSGAFGLSMRGQSMNATYLHALAAYYRQYAATNVIAVAPDQFKAPQVSMNQFKVWHEAGSPTVSPVLQMRSHKRFDLADLHRQLVLYQRFPLPRWQGRPVICFSNAGWHGIEFQRHVLSLKLVLQRAFPSGVWLHNLGAGWDIEDIHAWRDCGIFASADSIAWYTDADAGVEWGGDGATIYERNATRAITAART
ncbi:MAG: hypothetical protein ACOYL5_17780 [Phototrophicaceae bacterium]